MSHRRITAPRAGGVTIAVVAFIVLGMPESGLGTAWPTMRTDLGRSVADLGTLLVAAVAAYALTSAAAGRLVERFPSSGRSLPRSRPSDWRSSRRVWRTNGTTVHAMEIPWIRIVRRIH
jgi:MFS family permease